MSTHKKATNAAPYYNNAPAGPSNASVEPAFQSSALSNAGLSELDKGATAATPTRPSRSGKRGVDTLSKAQLERKRANDREAQRAIRERTRQKQQFLEAEVERYKGLAETVSSERLQAAIHAYQDLYNENQKLKEFLEVLAPTLTPTQSQQLQTVLGSSASRVDANAFDFHATEAGQSVGGLVNTVNGQQDLHTPTVRQSAQPTLSHLELPLYTNATSYFDELVLRLVDEFGNRSAQQKSMLNFLDQGGLDVAGLVNPQRHAIQEPSLSSEAINLFNALPGPCKPMVGIAIVYNIYILIRWIITQRPEHFRAVPQYLRPTTEQIQMPHPAWMDYVPWPELRIKLIHDNASITLDEFWPRYANTLSVNFSTSDTNDIWSCLHQEGKEVHIRSTFATHINDLRNWSVGTAFAAAYPTMAYTCSVRADNAGSL